jgi:hypothetical protein
MPAAPPPSPSTTLYLDPSPLPTVQLLSNVSDSVTIMSQTDDGTGNLTNTVANVTGVSVTSSLPDGNLIITSSSNNPVIGFSGQYVLGFNDYVNFRYVTNTNPLTLGDYDSRFGFGNVPPNQYLYEVNEDVATSKTITYTVLVNGNTTLTVNRTITRPHGIAAIFITNYLGL